MKITVFGCGYVGLVAGACLADIGHSVVCVDISTERVRQLQQGIPPICEPYLDSLISRNMQLGRLSFTSDMQASVRHGNLLFIAVGTPENSCGSADTEAVLAVARAIGQSANEYKLVVNKSTVPVGTANAAASVIRSELQQRGVHIDFDVCSNPEFLREGHAVDGFMHSARIVVGVDSDKARTLMQQCYARHEAAQRLLIMDVRSAELTKYAANAMLATKISFINEMASLADLLGANIENVRLGIGSDPRIGHDYISPGCGYGGSCLPKDIKALACMARDAGYKAGLVEVVESINEEQKKLPFQMLLKAFDGELETLTIAVWGLSFKPGTADMRDAPSRTLMEALWSVGAVVQAYDPEAMPECARIYGHHEKLRYCSSMEDALLDADALVVCTDWDIFSDIDAESLAASLKQRVVVDGRNIFKAELMRSVGISYYGVGYSPKGNRLA